MRITRNATDTDPLVAGDCQVARYERRITLPHWSLAVERSGNRPSSTMDLQESVDVASPPLAKLALQKTRTAMAMVRPASTTISSQNNNNLVEWHRFHLGEALVTSFNQSIQEDDRGTAGLTLSYLQLKITYRPYDGIRFGNPVSVSYDFTNGSVLKSAPRAVPDWFRFLGQ